MRCTGQELSPPPLLALMGVSSVLTMTTLSRKQFPCVSYLAALDFYIAICFVLCFCALLEFALLNFLTYNETKRQASPKLYHVRTGCWYGRQNFRMRVLCYGTWLASFPSVGKLTGVMEEINVLVWW